MSYETILVDGSERVRTITFNRPASHNSLVPQLLVELNRALDAVERDRHSRVVILQGRDGAYCTGMDFQHAATTMAAGAGAAHTPDPAAAAQFMGTLQRLSLFSRVVISKVDGQAIAGGVGLVAASDFVVATPRAQFSLPEALWGLLPCCVTPYLIRRVGFQQAYRLTLSTAPISAARAREIQLVDELSDDADATIRQLTLRLERLAPTTVANLKRYFRRMWLVSDAMEADAAGELTRLTGSPAVQANIRGFVEDGRFPWERGE